MKFKLPTKRAHKITLGDVVEGVPFTFSGDTVGLYMRCKLAVGLPPLYVEGKSVVVSLWTSVLFHEYNMREVSKIYEDHEVILRD